MLVNPIRFLVKLFRNYKYGNIKNDFILNDDPVQKKGELIDDEVFSGGPVSKFSAIGRLYLITLLKIGLEPNSRVLDIGCGSLRGGYWLIHFLNSNRYFGIEPNEKMLETGKMIMLDDEILEYKNPRFNNNENFDLSVFNKKFDFIIARSIWTHASKKQIEKMIDEFLINSMPDGVLLASYVKPFFFSKGYLGDEWVGKSHQSNIPGVIHHNFSWLQDLCISKGLRIRELKYDYFDQIWLHISRRKEDS